jgi:hypothetical protein
MNKAVAMTAPRMTDRFMRQLFALYLKLSIFKCNLRFMPMPNTYSFTKSDFAAMLQHIVDLIPEWMFLYDPAEDLIVYHNQKHAWLSEAGSPVPGHMPVSLKRLLKPAVLPDDWQVLEDNTLQLQCLQGEEIQEVRFRIRAADQVPGYRWFAFRQKLFWQDEAGGVKLILCLGTEVSLHPEGSFSYS